MVAHAASIDYCRCWQRYDGAEFAADIGILRDVIEKAYGRAPRAHGASEIATLPTPEIMVALLREGWLRRSWTQTLDEPLNGQSVCDVRVG
jgi:hypothetical protein